MPIKTPGFFAAHNRIDPNGPNADIQFQPEDLIAAGERLMRRIQEGVKPTATSWTIRQLHASYSIIMRWQNEGKQLELQLKITSTLSFSLWIYNGFTNALDRSATALEGWMVRRLTGENYGKLIGGHYNFDGGMPRRAITVEDPLFEGIPWMPLLLPTEAPESELGEHAIKTVRRYLVAAGIGV